MDISPSLEIPEPVASARGARRALISAAIVTALGDFLLWPATPRLSLALFTLLLSAAIFLNRTKTSVTRASIITCLLLIATAVQSTIELSFSNVLILLLLSVGLLGEISFPGLGTQWLRWSAAIQALMRAPLAWGWVRSTLRDIPVRPQHARQVSTVVTDVAIPTIAVVGVFIVLLSTGNAIFSKWLSEALSWTWKELPGLDFSFGRVTLWIVLATLAVGILHPALPASAKRLEPRAIPSLPAPRDLRIARWRSLAILSALNALFFAANTIDAAYLWVHGNLPEGVNYSDFVHQGVHSLIAAVLLSAVVLAFLFQQVSAVVQSRVVRVLALVWIGQNVLLIASVLLRLKLYVDAYQLTEQRVYVGCFLLLVTVGFGLLAWRIVASKSLEWLMMTNVLATFVLFFLVQFPDVARRVADYNVERWLRDASRTLDVQYLANLGHSAYPALIKVAEEPGRPEAHAAFLFFQEKRESERQRLAVLNWRSWQFREVRNARLLLQHEIRTRR